MKVYKGEERSYSMAVRKRKKVKILSKLPAGYEIVDPCRDLEQAIDFVTNSYPKEWKPVIIKTPEYPIFPYHIAIPRILPKSKKKR